MKIPASITIIKNLGYPTIGCPRYIEKASTMRNLLKSCPLLVATLLSQTAQAASQSCNVTLSNSTIDLAGNLYISGRDIASGTQFGWQHICNVTNVAHSVGLESCRSWGASSLTAVSSGKSMIIIFDDTAMGGRTNCANLPGWNPFYIQYLGLNN